MKVPKHGPTLALDIDEEKVSLTVKEIESKPELLSMPKRRATIKLS